MSGLGDSEHRNGKVTFRGTTYESSDSIGLINALKEAYTSPGFTPSFSDVVITYGGGLLGGDIRLLARANPKHTSAFSEDAGDGRIFTLVADGCYAFDTIGAMGNTIQFKGSGQ